MKDGRKGSFMANGYTGGRVILEVRDVIKQFKQYDSVVTAVNRVNFEVCDGEFVAIMGASGSGKSTLLHVLAGLDRPNSGRITLRGNEITAMNADDLAVFRGNYIGVIFQSHNLIPQFTALENILVPTLMCNKPDFSYEEHLKKLVSTLRIADRLHHLPSELSGGQQQRVAIARALINRPQIVFADEPTGNLDSKTSVQIMGIFQELYEQGKTIIVVTHEPDIDAYAKSHIVVKDGRILKYEV